MNRGCISVLETSILPTEAILNSPSAHRKGRKEIDIYHADSISTFDFDCRSSWWHLPEVPRIVLIRLLWLLAWPSETPTHRIKQGVAFPFIRILVELWLPLRIFPKKSIQHDFDSMISNIYWPAEFLDSGWLPAAVWKNLELSDCFQMGDAKVPVSHPCGKRTSR